MTTSRLAAGVMLRYTLYWGKWTLLVIALAYTAIGAGVATSGTPGEATSVWASSMWLLQWAALPGGIAVGYCVPVLVAHGLTRRSTIVAAAVTVLALALGVGALVQVGMAVEWLLFRAAGMPYQVDGGHLFRAASDVHLVLAEYTLNLGSFLVLGLLIFLAYYRLGWWRGTLVMPLAVAVPVGAVVALAAGWAGPVDPDSPGWAATIGAAPAVVLALAAVVAGLLIVWLLARTMPIRSK